MFFKAAETGFARICKVLHGFRKVFARLSRGTCTGLARVLQVCKEFAMVCKRGARDLQGLARGLQGFCKEFARNLQGFAGPGMDRHGPERTVG